MDRRSFLLALSAAPAARWAHAEEAAAMPTVAVLAVTRAENFKRRADALRRGMRELGYVEGKTLRYQWRYANDQPARLDELAREIAALRPAVAVADSSQSSVRLREAASGLAIVMAAADDPAGSRLVRSLEKPGTQLTGLSTGNPDEILKAVDFLGRVVPKGALIAVLANQNNATYRKIRARFRHAALGGGMQYVMIDANQASEIDAALDSAFAKERAAGVVVMGDALFYDERSRIVKRVAAARRAAIYPDRAYVDAGGLMSYGADIESSFGRAASYVDRILRGAAPGELPVEEPKEYRLVINRRTARALGLAIPEAMLREARTLIGT